MRIINADVVIDALNTFADTENGNKHFIRGINTAKEIIENAPTIEPPQGEWTNKNGLYPACTVCGYIPPYDRLIDDIYYSPYCPNCGAKMKGVES